MPLYEYTCEVCHGEFDIRRSFSDSSDPDCPNCNSSGRLRRRFSPPAIVFKGSGFYVTDARGKNGAGSPTSKKDPARDATAESSTSSSSSEGSAASKETKSAETSKTADQ